MAPTHLMTSVVLFLLLSPGFFTADSLLFFIIGAFLPDLDVRANHRRTLHLPFFYPVIAAVFYLTSFYQFSALFLSASLHCIMEIAGNDAGEYVDEDKGAIFNHLSGEWISGRYWIKRDGGPRDLLLLLCISVIGLTISPSLEIVLITLISLISGLFYHVIRDRVEEIFPDILLTR